jgi:hypothetical protein
LKFNISDILYTRKNIKHIKINHHLTYDVVELFLKDGTSKTINLEQKTISVNDNGSNSEYSFSKLDYIVLGN